MSFEFPKKNNQDAYFQNCKFDPGENQCGNGLDNVNCLESAPPSYFELGKQARDLFNSGYHFGLLLLNIVTKSPNNVKFTTTCIESLNRRNLFGSLEAQYELHDSLILTEKLNTDCAVTTELCCKNRPFKDFKVAFSGSISPRSGDKVGIVEAQWSNRFCTLNSKLEVARKFSLLTSSAVFKYKGLVGGVLTKFDALTSKLNDVNFAAGFAREDFILHTTFNNGSECGGSIFHKVTPRLDVGVHFVYTTNKRSDILFGIAGRYKVDDNICLRGKINSLSQLGLSCEQRLRDCIVFTFSVLFDVRHFGEGKYKLGFSLHFES